MKINKTRDHSRRHLRLANETEEKHSSHTGRFDFLALTNNVYFIARYKTKELIQLRIS